MWCRLQIKPQRLAAASAYGSAPMLNWLVEEKQITPHISVIDKSKREEPTLFRRPSVEKVAPTGQFEAGVGCL